MPPDLPSSPLINVLDFMLMTYTYPAMDFTFGLPVKLA